MNRRQLAAVTLALSIPFAQSAEAAPATELSLYGLVLKNATAADFVSAATKAGARPAGSTGGVQQFNVKSAGVPALERFELLTDGNQVVTVQFAVTSDGDENEMLRRMLVQKYGAPKLASLWPSAGSFEEQYISDGSYTWVFSNGMRLIYKKPFSGETTLSYTDEGKFSAMMSRAQNDAGKSAAAKAASARNNF